MGGRTLLCWGLGRERGRSSWTGSIRRVGNPGLIHYIGANNGISVVDCVKDVLGLGDHIGFEVGLDDGGDLNWCIALFDRGSEPNYVSLIVPRG